MSARAITSEQEVGYVTHYWSHLGVAGVHLTEPLNVGDHIHFLGHTSDFEQDVGSMELDHQRIEHADAGFDIGMRVADHVREHDKVYRRLLDRDIAAGENIL